MHRQLLLRRTNQLLFRIDTIRHISQRPVSRTKRFLQTSQNGDEVSTPVWPFKFEMPSKANTNVVEDTAKKAWSSYSLPKTLPKTDASQPAEQTKPKKRVKRKLRPRKALISLTPNAISHLKGLLNQPEPKLIRIGVMNRGCSGLTYDLQYIDSPGKFDEVVEQDGVQVVIDSKALFSIVGSEMDWIDDKLSSKFVFKNPNSKGTCGCGESFMV